MCNSAQQCKESASTVASQQASSQISLYTIVHKNVRKEAHAVCVIGWDWAGGDGQVQHLPLPPTLLIGPTITPCWSWQSRRSQMALCGRALLAVRVEQQDLQQTDYLNATKTRTKGQE